MDLVLEKSIINSALLQFEKGDLKSDLNTLLTDKDKR